MRQRLGTVLGGIFVVAAPMLAAVRLYAHTLGFGFDYDDYHFVRPYSTAEIIAAFHGPWDASGIELPYYRPLTIALFAARFEAFGINSEAYHAASVAAFAMAGLLAALVAWRFSGARAAGALAGVAFAVHPAMPYALVSWVTNQMHLLEILLIFAALLYWFAVRRRRSAWWLPLWLLAVAAFLVKEDGIMLLPVILVLHWLRRWMVERELAPRWGFAAGSAAVVVAMLALRGSALSGPAARAVPGASQAWTNYFAGLDRVFRLVPADRDWQLAASWFAVLLPLAGLACMRRASAAVRFTFLAGAVLAALFNLPFVFVTKSEQMHVVAAGAALLLGAAAAAILQALRGAVMKGMVVGLLAAGLSTFALVAADSSRDFEPFGAIVLSHDAIVGDWVAVPQEIRDYLAAKRQPGGRSLPANPADALDTVAFGMHSRETSPDGIPYRWMAGNRAEILVNARAHGVTMPLRHDAGAFRELVDGTITVDGNIADRLHFGDGSWRFSRIPLRPSTANRLWRMHRLVIATDHAWVPSAVIPGSGDSRTLGFQIGTIETH